MLKLVQELGERPTGAFPSSHIGVNVIILWYSFKYARNYFYWIIPVSVILFLSTVYIKAHYVVDIVGAIITLPLFVLTARYFYSLLDKDGYRLPK
jgi:membrane-associated phospholipid phosphatase